MEDNKNESSGRKNLLINPPYQLSVIFHFLILFFCVMIVTVFAINWQLEPVIEQVKLSRLPESDPLISSMISFSQNINITVLALTGFSFLMFAAMGLIVSHKSAGPIYSLTQHLRKIKNNNKVEPITFRKGDYFQELPVIVCNRFMRTLIFQKRLILNRFTVRFI